VSSQHHGLRGDSGNNVSRGFCSNCGSPILSLILANPAIVGIKAGSLDDPAQFKPAANVYMASAPPWAPVSHEITQFNKVPG